MGAPLRVTKIRSPVKGLAEEHWFYAEGTVLIFHNGLLIKTDRVEAKYDCSESGFPSQLVKRINPS